MMQKTNFKALSILVMVFFFWGFVAASNDILIPVFKEKLQLAQWQSQMISFAFYVAYSVGSLIYFLISRSAKGDILNRIGYKNGIIYGLIISAAGTLLFYPAAMLASFPLMISGLFIVGLGFSLQQTAANPLVVVLGNPAKGSQRLSLAGGVNNIGTTIGPVLVSLAIFGTITATGSLASIESVKTPYLILGAAFLLVVLVIKFSSLPNHIPHITDVTENETPEDIIEIGRKSSAEFKSATEYPQLWMGMIAIFVYVGVEVSTAANLPEFMRQHLHTPTNQIAPYVSLFWASLMIGRWTSAIGVFSMNKGLRNLMNFVVPYLAFGLFVLVNWIAGHDLSEFWVFAAIIPGLILADFLSKGQPARQLFVFSLFGIIALAIGMLADRTTSVFAFISVGMFCSTLWPCIFTLAIAGLGKHTNQGSGFLIMMIMGGGFISLFQGVLSSKKLLGIQNSYMVGVLCFAYLAFYALKVTGILKKQGVSLKEEKAAGH